MKTLLWFLFGFTSGGFMLLLFDKWLNRPYRPYRYLNPGTTYYRPYYRTPYMKFSRDDEEDENEDKD